MTGASLNGSVLYAFGNYNTTLFSVHKFNPATGSSTGQYMTHADFPGLAPSVYDIAYSSQGMWVARDESDSPVLCYNTSGVLTNYVMGTTVPAAAGLTVDPDGFLWVSDPQNDKIYKVDVTTSISDAGHFGIGQPSITPTANPFQSIAVINATGFPNGASVEVFDIHGRLVHAGSVTEGVFSWNASSNPAGAYMIRFSNSSDSTTIRMVKTGN